MPPVVFVFKVALADRKSIWRRIALRGSQTLDELHEAIYDAFDRTTSTSTPSTFRSPVPRAGHGLATRLNTPARSIVKTPGRSPTCRCAMRRRPSSVPWGLRPKQVFLYLFDFGDEWWHEITVEQIDATPEKGEYPRVLEKHGRVPTPVPRPG